MEKVYMHRRIKELNQGREWVGLELDGYYPILTSPLHLKTTSTSKQIF